MSRRKCLWGAIKDAVHDVKTIRMRLKMWWTFSKCRARLFTLRYGKAAQKERMRQIRKIIDELQNDSYDGDLSQPKEDQ